MYAVLFAGLRLALDEQIFDAAIGKGKFASVNLDPGAEDFAATVEKWKDKVQVITLGHDVTLVRNAFGRAIATARQK